MRNTPLFITALFLSTLLLGSGQFSIAPPASQAVGAGTGTVTSVGVSDPTNLFNITGSPVTTNGTISLASFKNESANTFFANNTSSSAAPTFQALSSLAGTGVTYGGSSLGIFPDGKTIQINSSGQLISTASGGAGATSVGLADSTNIFNITGTPVTSSGTLTLSTLKNQSANTFLANNTSGAAAPTFQALSSLAGTGVTFGGSSLGIFPDGKTIQLNASGQLVATATSSSGTGNVTGAASSTAGDTPYFTDTTGKAIGDNTHLNFNTTTWQSVFNYPSSQNASGGALIEVNVSNIQNFLNAILIDGTVNTGTATNQTFPLSIQPTIALASVGKIATEQINIAPTFSGVGGTSSWNLGVAATINGSASGAQGVTMNQGSTVGMWGAQFFAQNSNTTASTVAEGVVGFARGNVAAGAANMARANVGSSGKAYGSINGASQEGTAQAVGTYSIIGTTDASGEMEGITTGPRFSAASAADNTNTGADIYLGLANGASVFRIDSKANMFTQGAFACGYNYLTTTGNYTISNNVCSLIVNAGAIVSVTYTMPPSPYDGQRVSITSVGAITTLTISANSGQSMGDTATTLAAGATLTYQYVNAGAIATWFLIGH